MEKIRFCLADLFDCGQVAIFYRFSELSLLSVIDIPLLLDVCKKVKNTSILIPIPKARRTIEPCQANLRPSGQFLRAYLIR